MQKSSDSFLTNLASRDLMEHWRAGSQDLASVLWARYQVRLVALVAARLNRRYRNGIAAEDVVQSAITLEADEILADLNSQLTSGQTQLLDLLLVNATQREIAERLKVDERTVRRRIAAIRAVVAGHLADVEHQEPSIDSNSVSISLPKITYREFVLGKMVGRGALGKVYRARLQSDEQVVAVKFMHRHLWTNPASKSSLLREIDHASQIDHQGILKYLG